MSVIKRYTIEDCFHLRARIGWQGLRSEEFTDYGPYLVTGTDFVNGKIDWDTCYHVDEHRYRQDVGIQLREHDLLITKDGTIGKTAVVQDCPEKVTLNSGVFVVRAINRNVVPEFLYYVLNSHQFDLFMRNILTGSTIKHLNQEHFYKFAFEAPDATRQSKIAEILFTVDEAIDKTCALIEKYKNIKAGMMQDLLGKRVGEFSLLSELADTESGGTPSRAVPDYFDGNIPWVTTSELNDSFIVTTNECITLKWLQNSSAKLFPKGTVLMAMYGATIGKLGILAIDATTNQACCAFFCNDRIDSKYLYYKLLFMRDELIALGSGAGQPNISQTVIKKLKIRVPSKPEQLRIAEQLTAADERIQTERDYLTKLQNIKLGLMQDLLTNTVSVDALL